MPNSRENRPLNLARRQKRLVHWKKRFNDESITGGEAAVIEQLLKDYSKTISAIALKPDDSDASAEEQEASIIERKLTTLFDEHRLATSELGTAVAIKTSERS